MSSNAEADVLDSLRDTNELLSKYIDPQTNQPLPIYEEELIVNMTAINVHMQNLFKQHNEMTQFLTYANQLWQLESYISKKLQSDSISVRRGTNTMSTTIYDVRQRYMDKSSTVFYRTWITMVLKRSILILLLVAAAAALAASDIITPTVSTVIIGILIAYYFIWFYGHIDLNSRRDRRDPNIYLDWKYYPQGDNMGDKSCKK